MVLALCVFVCVLTQVASSFRCISCAKSHFRGYKLAQLPGFLFRWPVSCDRLLSSQLFPFLCSIICFKSFKNMFSLLFFFYHYQLLFCKTWVFLKWFKMQMGSLSGRHLLTEGFVGFRCQQLLCESDSFIGKNTRICWRVTLYQLHYTTDNWHLTVLETLFNHQYGFQNKFTMRNESRWCRNLLHFYVYLLVVNEDNDRKCHAGIGWINVEVLVCFQWSFMEEIIICSWSVCMHMCSKLRFRLILVTNITKLSYFLRNYS